MILKSTIERIMEAADIVEVIGEFVTLKRKGANFVGLSPFANERSPSFTVSPAKGIFKDFSSGKGGGVINFLMEHEKHTYPEALRWLANKYGIKVEESENTAEENAENLHKESLILLSAYAAEVYADSLLQTDQGKAIGLEYLRIRDFNDETIEKFQLGYAPAGWTYLADKAIAEGYKPELLVETGLCSQKEGESKLLDRYRDRIIFPIHSGTGRIIGFGGRTLSQDKNVAKYVNSPESAIYHKSNVLYGLYFAKKAIRSEDNCFLVEGYADVITLHQAGSENVVAASGTSLTAEQIKQIGRLTKNITVLFDGDAAGIKATMRSLDMILQEGLNVKILNFPDGHDPDSYLRSVGPDRFKSYLNIRRDFVLYKTEMLLADAGSDPVKRAGVIRDIVESIAKIPDAIKASIYLTECSKLLAIERGALETELNKLRANPKAARAHALEPTERGAEADEKNGEWRVNTPTSFTDRDIEALFPKYALRHVKFHKDDEKADAYMKIRTVLDRLHVHPLASYTIIENRRALVYEATPENPMFLFDEGDYKIIYQPYASDSSRYIPFGTVPKMFIHGLAAAQKEMQRRNKKIEDNKIALDNNNPVVDPEAEDLGPIKEMILVHDPAAALPLAIMGYYPFFITGTRPQLTTFDLFTGEKAIKKYCYKIYQVRENTDISKKLCHKLALDQLDIFNIELPETVKINTDIPQQQFKPITTLSDFFTWQNQYEFSELLKQAMPYRFWGQETVWNKEKTKKLGYKYDFRTTQSYNFLNKMGFYRMNVEGRKTDYIFVYRDGNIIREQKANDVKNFIHQFLEDRKVDIELRDTMYESTRLGDASLSNLKEIDFDFKDHDERLQYLFFQNGSVEITGSDIKLHAPGEINNYVWEHNVIEYDFVKTDPPFKINQLTDGTYDIEVLHTRCMFFNLMIQTSRMHWRRELEEELPARFPKKEDQEAYLQKHKFEIDSELLTPDERWEQKQHLINKIFTYGYAIHQYKSPSRAWAIVCTDAKMSHNDKSNGRTGKSLIFNKSLSYIFSPKSIHKIPGTSPDVVKNPHVFHGLDKTKKALIIDDADKNLPFRFFFEFITGDQVVNNKNGDIVTIRDEDLCKLIWLTNFIFSTDSSTEGRIIYSVFSDYYHLMLENGEYKETRTPMTEFGKDLFRKFTPEEFNLFYNTVAYCTQFFLQCPVSTKLNAPMGNVLKRRYLKDMGQEFEGWVSLYFHEKSGNLDKLIVKAEAMKEFIKEYPSYNKISSQWFKRALEAFCKINGFILNPAELINDKADGGNRIVHYLPIRQMDNTGQWVTTPKKGTQELIYIQTKTNEPVNSKMPGAPDEPMPF
jgi:DNA primase